MRGRGKPIPDDARAALLAWQPGNGTLNALADSLGVNRSSARSLRMRIKQRHRRSNGLDDGNESRRPDRCGVELIATPTETMAYLYTVGAKFTAEDLGAMVKYSALEDGTAFEITPRSGQPYVVEMRGGELVKANVLRS